MYILGGAIIWSLFPIMAVFSYRSLPFVISLLLSTILAGISLFAILLYRRKLYELKNLLLWKYAFYIVIFNGILYYVLYFFGLTKTTPGNASIISLFEVYTAYVLFHVIRKEHFSFESKIGSVLMVFGAVIVLIPNFSAVNLGDIFILIATFCAPMGNLFQQKARMIASTESSLFLRSLIAIPFLFFIAFAFGQHLEIGQVKNSLWFLLINGILVLGISKIFWVEGIIRIPVTKANALSSIAPLFTLFIAWLILHQAPTVWQIASFIPFFFGILFLTDNLKLKNKLILKEYEKQ
mgnify:CR=1 FL=1